jgi:serine phosphatase RsbU (regulator of sigma subunit)/anti-sigma regulatory factor (Ser/Thr protein kinase)
VETQQPLSPSVRFLASTSKMLASSYDFVRTLASVGDALVPAFADGFLLTFEDETLRNSPISRGTLAQPNGTANLRLPLVAGNRQLGTMLVAFRAEAAADGIFDRQTFEELAIRIAVAIDGANTYDDPSSAADSAHYTLLPERLPEDPRLAFDAAYLPGASEAIVGGDWYDAFELPDGRFACAIGDVAGHGLRAAMIMGEVRAALRVAALETSSPAGVLERANAAINGRAAPTMVTAVFAIIDPVSATLTYSSAGHPAPMIALADGSVQSLPADGIPLGIDDRVGASDWTFGLPPGSLFVLFTDGLIEFERDVVAGRARVVAAMRSAVSKPNPSGAARSIVRRVFADTKNTDDVAVLAVSAVDDLERDFTFEFSAIPAVVPLVRRALTRYLSALPLSADERFAIVAAVGEAIANAVEHGYLATRGTVRVNATFAEGIVRTTIADRGIWRAPEAREERGRGFGMMRELMSSVEIVHGDAGTVVRLTREVAAPDGPF